MASYTVEIQPQGAAAAGCSATPCTSYATGTIETLAAITTFSNYEAEATAAGTWVFDKWEFHYHVEYDDGTRTEDVVYRDPWNPTPLNKSTTGTQDPTEYTIEYKPQYVDHYRIAEKKTITKIVALFRNTRTPTHLLVNSASRSTPVQLVYDPATNLLVADY